LGSGVLGFFKWLKDPKNKKAIDDFTNFLENNAGLILGGLLALIGLRIGWKIFKWTRRLYRAFSWLKGKLPGGKPKSPRVRTPGSGPRITSSQSRPSPGSGSAKITGSGGRTIRRGLPKGGGARGGVGSLIVGTVVGAAMDKFITQPLEQKNLDAKIKKYESLPEEKKKEFRQSLVQRIFEQENAVNSPANKLNRAIESAADPVGAIMGTTTTLMERDLARNLALYEEIKEVDEKVEQKGERKGIQPKTPLMPGPSPSAAQPKTESAGNRDGSGVVKGDEVIMQKDQKAVGSTGVTKEGTAFNLGDINALKQEQEKFITQNNYSNDVRDRLIKPYDELLGELRRKKQIEKDIENINRNIASMPQQEWRWKPELEKKQKELVESSKKTTELFGKLGITDANLKQSQMRRGGREKDDSYVDPSKTQPSAVQNLVVNTQRLLGVSPKTTSTTTGNAGKQDGSGVVKVVPASHPDTGSGYTVEGQIDQSGRPVVFSNPAAQQFAKAVEDSGMNLGQYIASSGRSEAKNASLKGADPNSHHMYGEAIDMNGAGYEWMKANGSKYGWKYVYNHGPGSAHFKYVGPGAGSTPKLSPPGSAPAPPSAKITRTTAPPSAQVERTPAPTPSIPSPTGRGNIVPLPIPTGGGAQQASSGTAPNQAPVPSFSSVDPNNATTMVVRAIYNIVG